MAFFNSFNASKYYDPRGVSTWDDYDEMGEDLVRHEVVKYSDGSDAYANFAETVVSFLHLPSQKSIFFKAFISQFTEQYNSDWASEHVYGRSDAIHIFKSTSRKISLGIKIPAATAGEAYENLGKVQGLTQFLYPTYAKVDQAQTISQSPLVRLKIMNLIRQAPTATGDIDSGNYNNYSSTSDPTRGLLGVIRNLNVDHHLADDTGVVEKQANTVLPKLITINISFDVIHEHPLGWDENNPSSFSEKHFPYGVNLNDADENAPIQDVIPVPNANPAAQVSDQVRAAAVAAAAVYEGPLTYYEALAVELGFEVDTSTGQTPK